MKRVLCGIRASLLLFLGACSNQSEPVAQHSFAVQFQRSVAGDLDSSEEAEVQSTVFREIQNSLAECMTAEGFEYTPETDPNRLQSPPRPFFTEDDVRAHGFGIVARWRDTATFDMIGANDAYVDSLDEENRSQYFLTLEGGGDSPTSGGCTGSAEAAAYERLGITEIAAALPAVFGQVGESSRITAADSEWRACVSDLGVFTETSNLPEFVAQLQSEFAEGPAVSGDAGAVEEFERAEKELAEKMLDCNVARNNVVTDVVSSAVTAEVDQS